MAVWQASVVLLVYFIRSSSNKSTDQETRRKVKGREGLEGKGLWEREKEVCLSLT